MNIKRLEVVCGPGPVHFSVDEERHQISVWVGDATEEAPEDANKVEVLPGYTTFVLTIGEKVQE